jgi:hydroxymethylbilane synthase
MARPAPRLRLATRGSPLARWQADRVADLLRAEGVDTSISVIETEGDRLAAVPIERLGGRGVFAREVQAAVVRCEADAAVHSAKDLPAAAELSVPGLMIGAIPERADPRDLLVGARLSDLPTGSTIATGSTRRRVQLANLRPDLVFTGLRGNMATRLARAGAGDVTAVVVAKAATDRLGWSPAPETPVEVLEPSTMVPQVAQGALAVECRGDDAGVCAILAAIDDRDARALVEAERAFLAELGGGCTLPVGAHARWVSGSDGLDVAGGTAAPATGGRNQAMVRLTGMVAGHDGRIVLRHQADGADPGRVGRQVARYLLDQAGGRELLDGANV